MPNWWYGKRLSNYESRAVDGRHEQAKIRLQLVMLSFFPSRIWAILETIGNKRGKRWAHHCMTQSAGRKSKGRRRQNVERETEDDERN